MFNVTDCEEVQRRRHLAVQDKEHNRFEHQNKRHDHLTTRRALHAECFFCEDEDNTQCNKAQRHARNALVVQQPGCKGNQHHNACNCRQQFTEVHRFKVRLRAVVFNPGAAEQEVHHGNQHTHHA